METHPVWPFCGEVVEGGGERGGERPVRKPLAIPVRFSRSGSRPALFVMEPCAEKCAARDIGPLGRENGRDLGSVPSDDQDH